MSQSIPININSANPTVFNKASGDGNNGKGQNQREKCRSNIPKNLRYDLEKALVGLCDVWFDEIKPYLVHNNIKVHVNRSCGEPPECSHVDPASSASHCGLCQLLFNAANSIESAVCQANTNATPANSIASSANLTETKPLK